MFNKARQEEAETLLQMARPRFGDALLSILVFKVKRTSRNVQKCQRQTELREALRILCFIWGKCLYGFRSRPLP